MWLVTKYEDVLTVLKDGRFSKDYSQKLPWMPPSIRPMLRNLLMLDPPDHTRLRSLVQKAFTPRLIDRLRERIQRVSDDLLDKAAAKGRMDLVREYSLPLPLTIIEELLGIPVRDRPRFGPWAKKIARMAGSVDLMDYLHGYPACGS